MTVLVLGGTGEAVALARMLAEAGIDVLTSIAGRTREPREVAGRIRVGGFGGIDGLHAFLLREGIRAVIDATHPFAVQISANAARAAALANLPRLVLHRPPWTAVPGDRWVRVPDLEGAAGALPGGRTALLALGRQHLLPFAARRDVRFVIRSIEPATNVHMPQAEFVLARPSGNEVEEALFLRSRGVDAIVSRNSGGAGAYAKIAAARTLGLTVLMIDRPAPPPGDRVPSAAEAIDWVLQQRLDAPAM